MSETMPLIFLGHGSPMNAIEENQYTESWKLLGKTLPRPRAILMLSAHWITEGETHVSTTEHPEMIYDMYWFPPELYRMKYDAPGSVEIAGEILEMLTGKEHGLLRASQWQEQEASEYIFRADHRRGFDHGVWSTLIHLFPEADIPVITMSLDYSQWLDWHYDLGKKLSFLREQGILIIGSGNIVHNLGALDWSGNSVYPWAEKFDARIARDIETRDHADILSALSWEWAHLAHPTHDHLLPLFPLLGAVRESDTVEFLTPDIVMGSISMRSVVWR